MTKISIEEALMVVLDCVDYIRGNCCVNEMVGAVLPKEVIENARKALAEVRIQSENNRGFGGSNGGGP